MRTGHERIDEHGGHKRADDGADREQIRIGGKRDKGQISDKARAAGHADGGRRGKIVPHHTLQHTAGQRETDPHQSAGQDPWKTQVPDDEPRGGSIVHKYGVQHLTRGKLDRSDTDAEHHRQNAERKQYGDHDNGADVLFHPGHALRFL